MVEFQEIFERLAPLAPVKEPERGANTSQTAKPGIAAELERLAKLHQAGLLSEDEFKAAKQASIREAGGNHS